MKARAVARVVWILSTLFLFVLVPFGLATGFGISGFPEEGRGNPNVYVAVCSLKFGLPIWIPLSCVCLFIFRKAR